MMKLALMRAATGKEELPLLQRLSSLELPASEIAAQINASQSSSNRHISTSTAQGRLRESKIKSSQIKLYLSHSLNTRVEIIRSPTRVSQIHSDWNQKSPIWGPDQRTVFHRSNVHCSCFLAQESIFFLLVSFSSVFFAEI